MTTLTVDYTEGKQLQTHTHTHRHGHVRTNTQTNLSKPTNAESLATCPVSLHPCNSTYCLKYVLIKFPVAFAGAK